MKVIFAADANFFPGLQVSLASLGKDLVADAACTVDVLYSGLSETQMQSLRRVAERIGFDSGRIQFVDIDSYDLQGVKTIRGSKMTYARMLIPRLYPDEREVIYCDCDILFIKGIAELRKVELGDYFVAAAQDATVMVMRNDCAWKDVPDASLDQQYFNAGLMKLNLEAWRAHGIGERALEVAKRDPDKCTYWDQTILNYLCVGRVKFIDSESNIQIRVESDMPDSLEINIHFLGARKPWLIYSSRNSFSLWRRCYRKSVGPVPIYALSLSYWAKTIILGVGSRTGSLSSLRKLRRALSGW